MPHLSGLPHEVLIMILAKLHPLLSDTTLRLRPLNLDQTPLSKWPLTLKKYSHAARAAHNALQNVALTSQFFHALLIEDLCTQLSLYYHRDHVFMDDTLWYKRVLDTFITTVHVADVRTKHVYLLAFLPNIRTLSVECYQPQELVSYKRFDSWCRPGTSPLHVLRLAGCGYTYETLKWVLNFPKALKELWYDALEDPRGRIYGYLFDILSSVSCAKVRQAVYKQRHSLERFVFTRQPMRPRREQWLHVDNLVSGIDLRNFKKLRDLRIFHAFMSLDSNIFIPKSLRRLEILYENGGFIDSEPHYLWNILDQTRRKKLGLQSLSIISQESQNASWGWGGGFPENSVEGEGWKPPRKFVLECEKAGVSYSVYLMDTMKFRQVVKGGMNFDSDFEC